MEKVLELLKKQLKWSGERITDKNSWVIRATQRIEEQFKQNVVGEEMNIVFNSLGEFQGNSNEVDIEIANFCSLQNAIKLLEYQIAKERGNLTPEDEGEEAVRKEGR